MNRKTPSKHNNDISELDTIPPNANSEASTSSESVASSNNTTSAFDNGTSVHKKLALLAIPTFGQLIAEPTFVLIDTAIVGHVSDSALAGLSLGSTVVLTAVGLCVFLAYSTTSQVARLFGAGKKQQGLQAGMNGLWLSLCIGMVLAALLFVCAELLCGFLGGRGETLQQATIYTQMVLLGVPGMLLVYAANGIFRGLQKVSITLIAAVSGALVNTILDVLFVLVWGWGIAGSGIATAIAQWFMGLFLLIPAVKWTLAGGASLKPSMRGIASAGGNGFPLFVRTLALRVALVASVMAAASMGTEVLAAYQVVNAAWNFTVNALDSIAIAGQTLVGSELGARAYGRARMLTQDTARAGFVVGIVVGVVFAALGLVAGQLFSPNPSIQVLVTAGMVAVGVMMPLQGWMWALDGILIGAGDFRYLAFTCGASALVHIAALVVLVFAVGPYLPDDLARIAALWLVMGVFLMGGRGLANGLRAKGDFWMKNAVL